MTVKPQSEHDFNGCCGLKNKNHVDCPRHKHFPCLLRAHLSSRDMEWRKVNNLWKSSLVQNIEQYILRWTSKGRCTVQFVCLQKQKQISNASQRIVTVLFTSWKTDERTLSIYAGLFPKCEFHHIQVRLARHLVSCYYMQTFAPCYCLVSLLLLVLREGEEGHLHSVCWCSQVLLIPLKEHYATCFFLNPLNLNQVLYLLNTLFRWLVFVILFIMIYTSFSHSDWWFGKIMGL